MVSLIKLSHIQIMSINFNVNSVAHKCSMNYLPIPEHYLYFIKLRTAFYCCVLLMRNPANMPLMRFHSPFFYLDIIRISSQQIDNIIQQCSATTTKNSFRNVFIVVFLAMAEIFKLFKNNNYKSRNSSPNTKTIEIIADCILLLKRSFTESNRK